VPKSQQATLTLGASDQERIPLIFYGQYQFILFPEMLVVIGFGNINSTRQQYLACTSLLHQGFPLSNSRNDLQKSFKTIIDIVIRLPMTSY